MCATRTNCGLQCHRLKLLKINCLPRWTVKINTGKSSTRSHTLYYCTHNRWWLELGGHQGRPPAPLIRCGKQSKYGVEIWIRHLNQIKTILQRSSHKITRGDGGMVMLWWWDFCEHNELIWHYFDAMLHGTAHIQWGLTWNLFESTIHHSLHMQRSNTTKVILKKKSDISSV